MLVDEALIVIRTANERTVEVCRGLLSRQVPESNIVVIEERPFSRALHASFEAGMDHDLPWTICIDADVLVAPMLVYFLVQRSNNLPADSFGFTGYIFDKFLGSKRQGGPHTYRTRLLPKARKLIPGAGESLRPETEVKRRMARAGHTWEVPRIILGIHDFGQYYHDIFRKMVVRSHREEDLKIYFQRIKSAPEEDFDFKVAQMGLRYGQSIQGKEAVSLDSCHYRPVSERLFGNYGIEEKDPIGSSENYGSFIRSIPEFRKNTLTLRRHIFEWRLAGGGLGGLNRYLLRIWIKLLERRGHFGK